ncbi:protein FAM204A [Melanotaenia boesemani]|uniref:protein FAM204A n=1 Tax=Melanotaenia boesemani TaxID=1250792 RepID=UPI001C0463A4|nr:protein FAM204A [Melanotaenia boesemani]
MLTRVGMYSGLLPKGITEDELSPDEEEEDEQKDDNDHKDNEKGPAEIFSCAARNPGSVVEAQSSNTASDCSTSSMPGISQEMLQKFEELRKKKDEIKAMKIPEKRKRRRCKKGAGIEKPTETREHQEEREKHWDELKQYFGVNDRFHPPACSKPPPKSGLEKSIERAIAEGDIAKAEEMSDRLATREMAVKIAQAADCRDFVQHKQEEEALRAAQKRKRQIAWGFEAKKRWETKSNMGFM